jgi:hypothetical protein
MDEQKFITCFSEFYNAGPAKLAAVKTDVIGANACRHGVHIEEFKVKFVYFKEDFPFFLISIKGEKTFLFRKLAFVYTLGE